MSRNNQRIFQLHKKFGLARSFLRLFCLVIGIIMTLVVFLLSFSEVEVMAVSKEEGTITGSSSEGDTFWHGIASPKELKISQSITVKDTNYSLNKTHTSSKPADTTISLSFTREGKFQPSISVTTVNSHSAIGSGNTWSDFMSNYWYFSYVYSNSRGSTTYYKALTENESSVNMGATLFNYYKMYYNPGTSYKWSNDMMITTQERVGRAFDTIVSDCANANGWIKYTGAGIPLWQNGKLVTKIQMITVNPIDYYYTAYREDDSSSYHGELDAMLYTTHTYIFSYSDKGTTLKAPEVSNESGYSLTTGIPEDDLIILTNEQPSSNATSQYYLSDVIINDFSQISWSNYTEPFSPNGKKYLYVRSNYTRGSNPYIESEPSEYQLTYLVNSSAIISSNPRNGEGLDVGEKISLQQSGATTTADIFYVVDANSIPTLTRVDYMTRIDLMLDSKSENGNYLNLNGNVYIKINNIWYMSSNASLMKYSEQIITTEELRKKNTIGIYALVGDEGKEVGEFQLLRYTYSAKIQTEAPQSTVSTSTTDPTSVKMGDIIGLVSSTTGSRIFYTTNGKAPSISITVDGPIAGEDTKEYSESEQIIVNDDFANYGKTFLIMAQAVTYVEIDGNYYRSHQDSPVAKFTYKVDEQIAVESVQSIPQTNADTPLEIQVGNRIQLFSETEGVDIYYTLNGSEPVFDAVTGDLGENTYKYSSETGVIVEKSEDSSLFTITAVAYKPGLSVSNIARLVFAYPGAVSSPYANPASGSLTENTEVVLKTATQGAAIYYEIAYENKTPKNPSTTSKLFDETRPIRITQKTTVKAYAVKNGMESAVSTFTYDVSTKLSSPVPSIGTGAVLTSGTVLSLTADKEATIHYTLDGSDPKDSSNKMVQVGNSVVLNGEPGSMVILRAYATKTGYSSSDVGTYSYSISTYTGGIYTDIESGSIVENGDVIHLDTDISDAKIYYTTDGTAPTENSHSGKAILIEAEPGAQVIITAMAIADGSEKNTSFATFTYSIKDKLAAPTASVADKAVFTEKGVVELLAETGSIYYTTDGSIPSISSNLYQRSIIIDGPITIKAIAVDSNYQKSDISTFHYGFAEQVAEPIASYSSGELEMGTTVTFTTETEGATIYYRTDGVEPNLNNKDGLQIYTGSITVTKATNFKVIAVKEHMRNSKVLSVGYTVREPIIAETATESINQIAENESGRLQSRRSFSNTESGPNYTDIVLRNATYGVVVSGEEGSINEEVMLKVEHVQVMESVEDMVRTVLDESYGVIASYNVQMLSEDEIIQPNKKIEIGIPIPAEYDNTIVYLVKMQDDGYVKVCDTRRTGGMAYAMTEQMGNYSIVVPIEFEQDVESIPWLLIEYSGAVVLLSTGSLLLYLARKKMRKGE